MTFIKPNKSNARVLTKASTDTKPKLCRTLRPRWNLTATFHVIPDSDESNSCAPSFPSENDYDDSRTRYVSMRRMSASFNRAPLLPLDMSEDEILTPLSKKICLRRTHIAPTKRNVTGSDFGDYSKDGDNIVCPPTPTHIQCETVSIWDGLEPPFMANRPPCTEYLELPHVISKSLLLPNF